METLHAFRYKEGDTLLHRLDPRAKLLMALSIILYLWLRADLKVMLLVVPLLIALIAIGQLWRELKAPVRLYALLGLIFVPLNSLLHSVYTPLTDEGQTVLLTLTPPGTPILGELLILEEALVFTVVIYVRLVLMLLAMSVFIMSTSLDDVEALLFKLRFPQFFVLTMGFAFRFIPTVAQEAQRIREAQMARGLDPRSGGLLSRHWKAMLPLIFPLVVSVLRRALLFAEALEARATFVYPRRTVMADLRFSERDIAVVAASLSSLSIAFVLLYLQPIF
jgi:energy-coupling factor transport system permease protein